MKFGISAPLLPAIGEPMRFPGLTDFSAGSIDAYNQCQCGSVARVRSGLCASCLLGDALQGDYLDDLGFELELAEINIPDRDWRLGNYQILEEIARGGMGVVYRARHLASRRIVALKRVLTYHSDSQQTLARFRREAEAASSLDHPNILPVYDVGVSEDGLPYFSMKFAAGGSLLNAREQFRNEPRRAAELIAKVGRAINYAHDCGVVHRDLKPGNILLDGRGEPMVADFGLAKWLDSGSDLTCTLTVFGTPGYIAPEQAQGGRLTQKPAVDVYSLGAIFFELLSGRPPFVGEHALSVIHQASENPPPRLRSVWPNASRDLETICARCLDRDPARRYPSAEELAADLDRWLEDRPIVARQISPPARLWRWARRNRPLAASISACVAAACAAIAWQLDNWRLGNRIHEEQVASHSIAVLPFLNLDEGTPNLELSKKIADTLRRQMSAVGPAKVVAAQTPNRQWTGTGTSTELKSAVRKLGCRVGLVGMYRRSAAGGTRISIRFVDPNSNEAFYKRTTELGSAEDLTKILEPSGLTSSVYRMLDASEIAAYGEHDPTLRDPTAQAYYNAGRSLLDRRTIPDMDRAIRCFESAIAAAPRSPLARSYLALAYMGRNFLAADPVYIERGYAAAKGALEISPDDPVAHRALAALDGVTGNLYEALEHSLRALEIGDPTERTLGQIAYIWKVTGRPDKAVQWLVKAKMSDKQLADYDSILGDAWLLLADDKKAFQAYENSSNFRPELPEGWLGICHLKLVQGDLKQARLLFQQHAAEYSAFHTPKLFRAQLEFFSRNFPEAEQLYSDILRVDPDGVSSEQYGAISSMSALARIKMAMGDKQAATELVEKCIATDEAALVKSPKYAEVLYRLAAAEAIQGDTTCALAHLRESIAAGYIDYRSMRMDPRFDAVSGTPEFQQITSNLATDVAELRHRAQQNPNNN